MTHRSPRRSRRPYHHGDLRRAVLTAALDVIAADGPDALSLRDLARRAGVSHAAPAHHFKDRTGPAHRDRRRGVRAARATRSPRRADLRDAGVRYVRFARRAPRALPGDVPPGAAARRRPGTAHREGARHRGAARTGISRPSEPGDAAPTPGWPGIAAWSLAHGFATLLLGHNLDGPVDGRDPEEVFRTLTGLLFNPETPDRTSATLPSATTPGSS